jgi:hypothetical protein
MDDFIPELAFQSDDGPYSVNVLQRLSGTTPANLRSHLLPRLRKISEMIKIRLDEATDNPNHFEKVRWFARHWNGRLPLWARDCGIEGAGLVRPITGSEIDQIGTAAAE